MNYLKKADQACTLLRRESMRLRDSVLKAADRLARQIKQETERECTRLERDAKRAQQVADRRVEEAKKSLSGKKVAKNRSKRAAQSTTAKASRKRDPARETKPKPQSLEQFASAVQKAADKVMGQGRYDEDRVFVAAVWDALNGSRQIGESTLNAFKHRLVEANREGHLRLNRADLTAAMDPAMVAASEIRYLNATFHFIVSRAQRTIRP